MFRKISETFTATHLTIMFLGALMVPGAVYATVATTAVSITDPNTGQKSFVDAARRLNVYDSAAGFANTPSNYVDIHGGCGQGTYSIPAGKALIVKSVNISLYSGTSGTDNYAYVLDNLVNVIVGFDSSFIVESRSFDFGNGYFVNSGHSLGWNCSSGVGSNIIVTGYLVPAGAVPQVGSSQAPMQSTGTVSNRGRAGGHP